LVSVSIKRKRPVYSSIFCSITPSGSFSSICVASTIVGAPGKWECSGVEYIGL
jgi:hypothetical protein